MTKSSSGGSVFVLLLMLTVGGLVAERQGWIEIPKGGTAVADGPTTGLKSCELVVVWDKKNEINNDVGRTMASQDDKFWLVDLPEIVGDLDVIEKSDPKIKQFITDNPDMDTPFVMLVDGEDVVWWMPYPSENADAIRSKLDGGK